jgi:hypothetical protein
MKIGIDIDGTITANPDFFREFISDNLKIGNEVHIITGCHGNKDENEFDEESRVEQLGKIGINKWTKMVQVTRRVHYPDVSVGKGEYCRDNEIALMFEDHMPYIEAIKEISPGTQVVLMQ